MNAAGDMPPAPAWAKPVLLAAAAYNLVWGTWVVLFPSAFFAWIGMKAPDYPQIWQCLGMVVGVYGVGYAIAAFNPYRHWPIVLVGLLGKVLGPIGFLLNAARGILPWKMVWLNVANDFVWWLPFGLLLLGAWRFHRATAPAARRIFP